MPNIDAENMSIFLVLCWVVSGGSLGGLCDYFNRFKIGLDQDGICFQGVKVKLSQICSLGLMNIVLGIGGALSVQFAMISIGKFPQTATVESQFLLFTISVVAGFGGRRFLHKVSNKLEDQIGEAKKISEEAKAEAEESIAIATAYSTLRPGSAISERLESVRKLESMLTNNPEDRTLTILVGRLHRRNGDYLSAIDVLTRFINLKLQNNMLDKDYADVLYNRACYQVLIAAEEGVTGQRVLQNAIKDLRESVRIVPESAEDAKDDPDFESLRENKEFQELTAQPK